MVKHLKHSEQLVDDLRAAREQAAKPSSRQPAEPEFSEEPKKRK